MNDDSIRNYMLSSREHNPCVLMQHIYQYLDIVYRKVTKSVIHEQYVLFLDVALFNIFKEIVGYL